MKTYFIGLFIAGSLLTLSGFVLRGWYGPKPVVETSATVLPTQPPTDAHGCDLPGGFVWCEPKQKCLQLWDEKCEGVVPATDSGKVLKK